MKVKVVRCVRTIHVNGSIDRFSWYVSLIGQIIDVTHVPGTPDIYFNINGILRTIDCITIEELRQNNILNILNEN